MKKARFSVAKEKTLNVSKNSNETTLASSLSEISVSWQQTLSKAPAVVADNFDIDRYGGIVFAFSRLLASEVEMNIDFFRKVDMSRFNLQKMTEKFTSRYACIFSISSKGNKGVCFDVYLVFSRDQRKIQHLICVDIKQKTLKSLNHGAEIPSFLYKEFLKHNGCFLRERR